MTLFLVLKKQYFDQIESGQKINEYRALTPFWAKRLCGKWFDKVIFQNGYSANAPRIEAEYCGFDLIRINHEFFGNFAQEVFDIKIKNARRTK